MQISARNQLKGTITKVQKGAVNGIVRIEGDFGHITADITNEAIEQLGLAEGKPATAIIKATSVMFATDIVKNISARNQLKGTIVKVKEGAVNGHVVIKLADGSTISGSITNDAIEQLGFAEGCDAVAIIKSTEVMVGVE